jgi:hypothetical protein
LPAFSQACLNDRCARLLLVNELHRLQPIHSRHEDIENQQVEISGFEHRKPLAAVAGDDNGVTGPLQHDPAGRLHGKVVVQDQDVRQSRFSECTNHGQRRVVGFA